MAQCTITRFGALFVGGGNYSSALLFVLASALCAVIQVVKKRERRVILVNVLTAMCSAAGLIISMAAPGNAVRQSSFDQLSVVSTILMSFRQAATDIVQMTDIKIVGAVLMCVPLFLYSLPKEEQKYPFKYPLLVAVLSFCAFAALNAPPLFALSEAGPPRLRNMIWLYYVFFLFGNAFYIAGWMSLKCKAISANHARRLKAAGCVLGAVIFTASVLTRLPAATAFTAYQDVQSGILGQYEQELEQRKAAYDDKSILSPRFEPITAYPNSFVKSQILTWASDLLVDGVPAELQTYHACGGEVTVVGLTDFLDLLAPGQSMEPSDFSKVFNIGGKVCVPIRELCNSLEFQIDYSVKYDTITITTK